MQRPDHPGGVGPDGESLQAARVNPGAAEAELSFIATLQAMDGAAGPWRRGSSNPVSEAEFAVPAP